MTPPLHRFLALRHWHPLWAIVILLLVVVPNFALSQGCGIAVTAQPHVVNFPGATLPSSSGLTFAEVIDVNYSSTFVNRTLTLQYLDGSRWVDLHSFTGNRVGFTELDYGLTSAWAEFGDNTVRVVSGSCSSGNTAFAVVNDPNAVAVDLATYGLLVALVVLFLVLGMRIGWKKFALLGAAVYLAVSPFTGQRYDVFFLLSSGIRILQHVDPFNPGIPPLYPGALKWAYPPLYPLYSAFSFVVYQAVTGYPLPSVSSLTYPGWLTSPFNVFQAFVPSSLPVLVFLLKIPMVVSAVVTGLLLKRITGDKSSAVWWVANPLVILVAAVWGQTDPIATVLAVAAVYSFERGKPYHAYLFASFGAAVKVWPALLVPLFFVVSLRKERREAFRPLLAVVPALLATVGIYAAYGNPVQSLYTFLYARGIPTFAGAFSVNGLTWQEILLALKSPPVPLFLVLGIPLYGAILAWMYWKKSEDVVKWLVVSILVFYLTYNYVNPQYFYWILPFLILQRRKLAVVVFTALPLAYMAFAYDVFYFVSPALLPDQFALGASIVEQLKVNYFYQSFGPFVLVAALVPTAAYVLMLLSELKMLGRLKAKGTGNF